MHKTAQRDCPTDLRIRTVGFLHTILTGLTKMHGSGISIVKHIVFDHSGMPGYAFRHLPPKFPYRISIAQRGSSVPQISDSEICGTI